MKTIIPIIIWVAIYVFLRTLAHHFNANTFFWGVMAGILLVNFDLLVKESL